MHQTWKTLNDIYSSWWKSTESVSRAYPNSWVLSGKCNDPGSARELTHLNPSRL
jgi:hypothetical protein